MKSYITNISSGNVYQQKEKLSVLAILILLAGICIILYPFCCDKWNEFTSTVAITKYEKISNKYNEEEVESFLLPANEYNKNLTSSKSKSELTLKYNEILNIDGMGMMGYVVIPKINVKLPIYHGFGNDVLDKACGHLEGSSLPVGGESTHCVISAHRGLPSARLFSDLNRLSLGDVFSIEVLNTVLYYKVDQIKIVEPGDIKDTKIIRDMDLCTLVTCTPYGINTQRLLVRGVRCDNPYSEMSAWKSEAFKLNPLVCLIICSLIVLILIFLIFFIKTSRWLPVNNKELDKLEKFEINRLVENYE